ncbi:MAG: hypothetical protein WAN66_14220 [Limnoraphis robusta]|uniref:Uncharacterized protein n=1 Tax=Limnoraphis robusta CS-951 TaxID=1637645 RepID=A0A0F5YJA0_9CYAN|nr:hypothetical protein [Limnoraphis robusta]KKD38255.1 hypothetical protein WN50_09875 [Limnoraphis robusta CS-951]
MTKHDTWVKFKSPSNFDKIKHLFPHGIPMRDPFPMEVDSDNQIYWVVDETRLIGYQADALIDLIADEYNVTRDEVEAEAERCDGLILSNETEVASLTVGTEGFTRNIELAKFYRDNPNKDQETFEKLKLFFANQIERWIKGDEIPPPLPAWEDIPEEIKTPELESIYQQAQIYSMLNDRKDAIFSLFVKSLIMGNITRRVLKTIYHKDES